MRFSSIFALLAAISFPVSVAMANEPAGTPEPGMFRNISESPGVMANEPTDTPEPAPWLAQVDGTGINLRSGASITNYICGTVSTPDSVLVVEQRDGWSKIVPPKDSFSWVCKHNVRVDLSDPATAHVIVQPTRIWAGAPHRGPLDSNQLQAKLNITEKVTLLHEQQGDYYKIAPPANAFLWINSQYLKSLGDTPAPANQTTTIDPTIVEPATTDAMKQYEELAATLAQELDKPWDKQDYSEIRKSFKALVDDPASGRVGKFAAVQLERIDGYELVLQVTRTTNQQDESLQKLREQIRLLASQKLEELTDFGKYAVTGIMKRSMVYGDRAGAPVRYLIIDDSGRIVCYAQAAQGSPDLTSYIDRKIGLVGEIKMDASSSLVLVSFTQIDLLD